MNDHYNTAIQPIAYINANGLPFCEGNVVKYITRYKRKGGYDDLIKCVHYVLLTMEREYGAFEQGTIETILETLKAKNP